MTGLLSPRHDVAADPVAFQEYATVAGWGDGLPLIPPTPERVDRLLATAHVTAADEVIATIPPLGAPCTMEKLAIAAVMAGAPAESMPLLVAALRAMAEPDFQLHSLNATTGSVVPLVLVNGPVRTTLGIPSGAGCLGGVAGPAPAIGRALRLVMRNIGGQKVGVTSQSVFGQPGRVSGIVFGEWEEESPWAPLAARRGVAGSAVTVYGAMGTMNVCDTLGQTGGELVSIIGRSLAVPGANGYLTSTAFSEALIVINPTWAGVIATEYPDIADLQQRLWELTAIPITAWPERYHAVMEETGRVADGRIHLVQDPEQVFVTVAGGKGSLHATIIHSWGATLTTTAAVSPLG